MNVPNYRHIYDKNSKLDTATNVYSFFRDR